LNSISKCRKEHRSYRMTDPAKNPLPPLVVQIDYTNHRGERSVRKVLPERLYYGSTEYHPKLQYLLEAIDVERDVKRTFALSSIHCWGGREPWFDTIIDACVIDCIDYDISNPRKTLNKLLYTEQEMALDPAISKQARALVAKGKGPNAMMALIEDLRAEEPSSVKLVHDNPDFGSSPNCIVECNAYWTGFNDEDFGGDSLLAALTKAKEVKDNRVREKRYPFTQHDPITDALHGMQEILRNMMHDAEAKLSEDGATVDTYKVNGSHMHALLGVLKSVGFPIDPGVVEPPRNLPKM
jgi:hypothetical protein